MVFKLSDVVFRRTDLGAGGNPGDQALRTCADIVAKELGWTADQAKRELLEVAAQFPKFQDTRHRSLGEMELSRAMPDSPLT